MDPEELRNHLTQRPGGDSPQRGAQVILPLFKNNSNNKAAKQISGAEPVAVRCFSESTRKFNSGQFHFLSEKKSRMWRKKRVLEVCEERSMCELIGLIGCGQYGSPKGPLERHGQVKIWVVLFNSDIVMNFCSQVVCVVYVVINDIQECFSP